MKNIFITLLLTLASLGASYAQDANTSPSAPVVESINPETPLSEPPLVDPTPTPAPAAANEIPPQLNIKPNIKPVTPKPPRTIPTRFGDTTGEVFIGQRTVINRYAGWGWIRREKDTWRKSKWVMLEETPGVLFAPGRYLGHPDRDNGTQYKLYGTWATYKGYEPNFDVFVDVFQIKGFELIGAAEIPKMSPPRSSRGRSDSEGTYSRGANLRR
ncbi:MAG: hypothetical protein SH807_04540 [Blastochloris sp.]|nr:hypothetical protein [Blastochloris sp.]